MERYYDFVYLGSDNYVPLTLTDAGAPIVGGITNITRAVATLSQDGQADVVIDSVTSPNAFDWNTQGSESVIRLTFGDESIPPGVWNLRLHTYDAIADVVWCDPVGPVEMRLEVVAAP